MSTPTTTELDELRSRLPDPTPLFPEMAAVAKPIPGKPVGKNYRA